MMRCGLDNARRRGRRNGKALTDSRSELPRKGIVAAAAAIALAGCAADPRDIAREPHLTPVGAGLRHETVPLPAEPVLSHRWQGSSAWRDSGALLFQDPRAATVGDVVTVKISIKDRATLDNTFNRSRSSKHAMGMDFKYKIDTKALRTEGEGSGATNGNSATSTKSDGAIARSESIEFQVAAVVTEVLPNGNLIVSGSQEVRVNFEVRVLSISGIVRPRDVASDNSISYEKIAEARISYGGRGRIMEVQQPGWGHQILDLLNPF